MHSPSHRVGVLTCGTLTGMGDQPGHREFMKRKTKAAIKQHWTESGRWQDFVAIREHLKGEGYAPEEAWYEADKRLELGWEPPSSDSSSTPAPRTSPEDSGGLSSAVEAVSERASFKAETASIAETVRWVASFLMVSDASPEDAPSAEAWAMLQWARRNNANEAAFWGQIWRQLMPTKQALEAETRFNDDGKPILELISRIKSTVEPDEQPVHDSTEGADGEP